MERTTRGGEGHEALGVVLGKGSRFGKNAIRRWQGAEGGGEREEEKGREAERDACQKRNTDPQNKPNAKCTR